MTRIRDTVVLTGLVLGIGVVSAPMASAHATLVGSTPSPGSTLRVRMISLHFGDEPDPARSAVSVVDRHGVARDVAPLVHPGADVRTLTGEVPTDTANGAARIDWRSVAAADGHVSAGGFAFTVRLPAQAGAGPAVLARAQDLLAGQAGSPSPRGSHASDGAGPVPSTSAPAAAAAPSNRGVSGLFSWVRMISYLAMALLCGGLAFLAVLWPEGAELRRSRLVLWAAWGVGLLSTGFGIALEGAVISQRGLGSLGDPGQLGTTLAGHFGTVWAARGLLYLIAVPLLAQLSWVRARVVRSTPWLVAMGAVTVAMLRTPGLVGHASEGRWALLGSVADLVHLAGVAVWLGGLGFLCLVVLPRRQLGELQSLVPRFSRMAMVAVGAVVVAGMVMSAQLVGSFGAMATTRFGHVLLVKLGIFAAVLGAAQLSRRWVDTQLTVGVAGGGAVGNVRPFVYSVAAEAVLAIGILSAASVLVNTSPPR